MRRRTASAILVVAAAALGALGAEGLAFYVLVAAVGTAAIAALEAVGALVDARCGDGPEAAAWCHALLGTVTLVLVVAACAAEAPGLALGSIVTLALQALVPAGARVPEPGRLEQPQPVGLRRAA